MAEKIVIKGVVFHAHEVRATLDDRMTQFRRVVKLPSWSTKDWRDFEVSNGVAEIICASTGCSAVVCCPFGKIGDRLFVKESWANVGHDDSVYVYKADFSERVEWNWKPSTQMPQEASRIILEIANIRVEQLKDITEEDAIASGISSTWDRHFSYMVRYNYGMNQFEHNESAKSPSQPTAVAAFRHLWDSINADRGYPWDGNPWTWVVDFRRIVD